MSGSNDIVFKLKEPEIVINGVPLTPAQAMTVRVALALADFECGNDSHGQFMQKAYRDRAHEVMTIMVKEP